MTPSHSWLVGFARRQNHWISRALVGAFASINLTLAAQTAPTGTTTTTTTTATPTADQVSAPAQAPNETPIVLDPFVESASSNVGYGAGTTSSTARLVQAYVDVPQTVNVITSEFLQDINSQDIRQALEYVPNIDFGLNDNPYSTRLRAANVTSTYVDGVTMPGQYSGMPIDFFDRIEVVKGPSSITFGLGQPGGLINYVSKIPQGINSTSVSFGVGNDSNYLFRLDMQKVDRDNPKLSYRVVAFWDDGGYETKNIYHSGAGAQVSVNYALNKTTNLGLIVAYSKTTYPAQEYEDSIFGQYTLYNILQNLEVGNPVWTSLPGTKFSNGSVFGVSGQLPVPGTTAAIGIPGTGQLDGVDGNINPPGWDGDIEETTRVSLLLNKSLADGHINIRNQLVLQYNYSNIKDETPTAIYSVPGPNNTLPAAADGNPNYGEPAGLFAFTGGTGVPLADLGPGAYTTEWHQLSEGSASSRYDEIDAVATYNILKIDWQALIGADFYDSEQYGWQYNIPTTNPDGSTQVVNLYSSNSPPMYVPSTGWQLSSDNSSHTWGDGFFAQVDALPFHGMFDLMAGWRIDYFDTETLNYAGNTTSFPGWVNTKGAPRFALTYKPVKWLSVYGLYTKHADPTLSTQKYFLSVGNPLDWTGALASAYPPTELEYYQPGGYTVEGGAKASLLNGKIYASVAVFHEIVTGDINSLVVARGTAPDGSDYQIAQNTITGFNAHGIEAEVFGQVTNRLTFTADFGFTRGNYPGLLYSVVQSTGVTNGSKPNWVDPPEEISGHLKYDFGNGRGTGFYATFGTEFWSPFYIWETASYYSYYDSWQHQIDAGLGYRWKTGKYRQSIFFNCQNIENSIILTSIVTPWQEEQLRTWFCTYNIKF